MPTITVHIRLTEEDKSRPEVIDLLVRESGNTKEEIEKYLRKNDVIKVPELPMVDARNLILLLTGIGVVATMGPGAPDQALAGARHEPLIVERGKKEPQRYADPLVLEGSKRSWNWCAFAFTFLWYAFKRLWVKLTVYIMIQWAINKVPFLGLAFLLQFAFWIYIGMYANYDLYLKEEMGERLWPKIPFKKWKKLYIACCIGFLVFAVALPLVQTARITAYSVKSFMEEGGRAPSHVELCDGISFTSIPAEWWHTPRPPAGMEMNVRRPWGNGEQTISYEASSKTKLLAVMSTKPLAIGQANESLGVAGIDLLKTGLFKKFSAANDEKTVALITKRFNPTMPFYLTWINKFYKVDQSRIDYQKIGAQTWGACTFMKEVGIAGQKMQVPTDVYWTVANNSLIIVYTDYFFEFRDVARGQVKRVLNSLYVE